MASPIRFYFDFSSPYGYLAAQQIDDLAARHGRQVAWKPFLLGAVFGTTRSEPLLNVPMKGDYARRDMSRIARRMDVPFMLPAQFPFASVAACRAFYWLYDHDPERARKLAQALFHEAFGKGRDVSTPDAVADVAAAQGEDSEAILAAVGDPEVKARLRREVDAAIQAGVFGSPFIIVDGEPFWGQDRLDHVEEWLETGGW